MSWAKSKSHTRGGAYPKPFSIVGTYDSIQLRYLRHPAPDARELLSVTAIISCALEFAARIRSLVTPDRLPSSALGPKGSGERISPSNAQCNSVNLYFGSAYNREITLEEAEWSLQAIAQAASERGGDGKYRFNEEAKIVTSIVSGRQIVKLAPIEMDELDLSVDEDLGSSGQVNEIGQVS